MLFEPMFYDGKFSKTYVYVRTVRYKSECNSALIPNHCVLKDFSNQDPVYNLINGVE